MNRDGKKCIYKLLDWSKPKETAVIVGCTVAAMALVHFIVCGLYSLKNLAVKAWRKKVMKDPQNGTELYQSLP